MQLVFIVVYVLGLVYYTVRKRRFDVFSLAYLSCGLYFMPGFVGVVLLPTADGQAATQIPLEAESYLVFSIVCLSVFIGGVISDHTHFSVEIDLRTRRKVGEEQANARPIACWVLFILSIAGLAIEIIQTGDLIIAGDKTQVVDESTRGYVLFTSAASLLFVASFAYRRWIFFAVSAAMLLFDVYVGYRYSFATSMLAITLLFFSGKNPFRLVQTPKKYLILLLCFGAFVFLYKGILAAVKLGAWEVASAALRDEDYYISSFLGSEPFVTQLILNEAVSHNFHMESPTPLDFAVQLVPMLPELGLDKYLRPIFMADMLLPGFSFGLGNNIWAEMWIYGGMPFVVFFAVFFNLVCWGGTKLLLGAPSPLTKAFLSLLFAYWAFYIHRNNVSYQLTLEKRVFFMFAAAFLFEKLIFRGANTERRRRNAPGSSTAEEAKRRSDSGVISVDPIG